MFQSTFACFSAKYQNMKGWLVLQIFFKLIEVIIHPFSFLATFLVRCDQWFLQTMCSGTKEEKPLRATVCFSIEHARPRDDFEYPTTRRQRERSQNNRFNISKTTTLHVHHAFLCISLPFSNDYDVKMPNFAILSLGIQLQLGSPTFGKVSR